MKLESVIEEALSVLPTDSIVRVDLSQGGFRVHLEVHGNVVILPATHETLAEAIQHAVETALSFMVG
jgi:hypothetical protein